MGAESGEDDQNKPLMDEGSLTEALSSIRELAGSFDYDSIKYIMETIMNHRVPASERKKFMKLNKAIMRADWDKIRELLGIEK